MALSSIALCSRALLKLGASPISGFEEGTAESLIAGTLYASTRDAVLSAYPWSFATAQRRLARLNATPTADYDYAYQLPGDFLRALSAGQSGRGRGAIYRIAERRLHTNAEDVVLTYVFRPQESETPPYFDQVLIARLAAEFVLPLTESTSRADVLSRLAEEEIRRARLVDAQQDVPPRFEDFSLIEVRSE
ncbi:MAG: hypothetical protein WD767_20090 [Alphaproteobacteria bacterium]